MIHVFETKKEGLTTKPPENDFNIIHNGSIINHHDPEIIEDNTNFVCAGNCDKIVPNSVVIDMGSQFDLL